MGRGAKIGPLSAGFTLVELLVVLVIMVMVYGLAAPMVSSGMSGAELKASARQLAAGLRKARSEAVARRHETALLIDVEERRFQLTGDQHVYRLPKDVDVNLFTATSELLNERTGAIRFYPDGGSTGGRITVSAHGRKYAVDVNWLTGQVAILD